MPASLGDRPQLLHGGEHVVVQEALDEVRAALLVGRPRPFRHGLAGQVLAGEHALRERRPDDLRHSELFRGRDHLLFDDAPQREYCGWFDTSWNPSCWASACPRAAARPSTR
jgi:hypothetical protein